MNFGWLSNWAQLQTHKHKPLEGYKLQCSSTVKVWTYARVFSIWYYVPDPMMIIIICPALTFKDSQYDHLLCWSVTAHSLCGQLLGLELVTQPCNNHMIYQTQWILRNQWDYLCPYSVSGRFLPWPFSGFTRDFLALLLNSVPFTGILDLI